MAAAVGRIGAVLNGLAGLFLLAIGPSGLFGTVAATMLISGVLLLLMRSAAPFTRERIARMRPPPNGD